MISDHTHIKVQLKPKLADLTAALAKIDKTTTTILCIPRHGYATTKVNIESIYQHTDHFVLIYMDINSPPYIRDYLKDFEKQHDNFFHIRLNEFISRQSARLVVLDLIRTEYTLFIDNNILVTKDWLTLLIDASKKNNATIVSPLITMQGGNIHFSGSKIIKNGTSEQIRVQTTDEMPILMNLNHMLNPDYQIRDIDFAESHACLMRTDFFQHDPKKIFIEEMHNAHTIAIASYYVLQDHARAIIEPRSQVSILPIGYGYDIPWLFGMYNDLTHFKISYNIHCQMITQCQSSSLSNLSWHRIHLLYLLNTMTQENRLEKETMIELREVPEYIDGYDAALPDHIESTLSTLIRPFVVRKYPEYTKHLDTWLYNINDIINNIDLKIKELKRNYLIIKRSTYLYRWIRGHTYKY